MKERWDERYKEPEFAYGKAPNVFFKEWLTKFVPGKILMPADGEGRNGVFAAQMGWQVQCFDLSTEGQTKALQLAKENNVSIDYTVGDFDQLDFEAAGFDAIGLVYAHFPADKKSAFHKKLNGYLKPGGIVIFEAFSKQHLQYKKLDPKVGGPDDLGMLFSTEELAADFSNYEVLLLTEDIPVLEEGKYHQGQGSVIRFVGRKK